MKKCFSGFTITEVMLVLAVAGMIFAITLAVLPTMWANERDSVRRDDIMKFIAQVKNFQTNNNRGALPTPNINSKSEFGTTLDELATNVTSVSGNTAANQRKSSNRKNPTTWLGFYRDFFDDDFRDPNGNYYDLRVMFCSAENLNNKCTNAILETELSKLKTVNNKIYVLISAVCDGDTPVKSANARRVAAVYRLEHSGQFCYND